VTVRCGRLDQLDKLGYVQEMIAFLVESDGITLCYQKRLGVILAIDCLAKVKQGLAQVLASPAPRMIGPQQPSQRIPLMWILGFDTQVRQQGARFVGGKRGDRFAFQENLESTE
jgi:hypothetical protein